MIPVDLSDRTTLLLNQNWFPAYPITAREAYTGFRRGAYLGLDRNQTPFRKDEWFNYAQETDKGKREKLTPVAFHPDQPILRSVHHIWPIPTVVAIVPDVYYKYARMSVKHGKVNKWLMCKREKFRCKCCGKTFPYDQLTIDHVIPRDLGGPDEPDNWTVMCAPCNNRKGNRLNVKDFKGDPITATNVPGWHVQINETEYREEWGPHLLGMKPQ
jgi:5-methylcytosine-specific restriction endonuclease McrA